MKIITLSIAVLILAISCEKDNELVFSGITERDEFAVPKGSTDDTDWRFDDIWNEREEGLFDVSNFKSADKFYEEMNYSTDLYAVSSCMAYPNPAVSVFNFNINSEADTLRFVIVDNDYHIIFSKQIIGGIGLWMFDSSNRDNFKLNSVYRIYYKLLYLDGSVERGHGDVKIID